MALPVAGAARGGSGGSTTAVTRLNVIDPHLIIMLRDVMDTSETAARLNANAGSGGGGGGGSVSEGTTAQNASTGTSGADVTRTITTNDGAAGGKGSGGVYDSLADSYAGGGGGGGAGGNGGAVIIISTTAAASMGTCQVNGGSAGSDGTGGDDGTPDPEAGNSGKLIQIQI